jgi:hypothetical protein
MPDSWEEFASMLNLRIVESPLEPRENEAILSQYNQLTSSRIPLNEFLHWVLNGPAGPAWHAILETDAKEIVGHTCLIPFRGNCDGRQIVPAKSEYTFIREEFQGAQIRGQQKKARPRNLILIDHLFRHCATQGWGPFLISTSPALHRLGPSVGCYPTDFPLRECFLILRPWRAAWETPNLSSWQRAMFCIAGLFQAASWSVVLFFASRFVGLPLAADNGCSLPKTDTLLSFFEDGDSFQWRYPEAQYIRLSPDSAGPGKEYVIAKKGSPDRYLRICQWHLGSDQPTFSLVAGLIQMAKKENALGVRWAVYGGEETATTLVRRMRRLGFLCAPRVRTLLLSSHEREFLAAEKWKLTDAMFSFDP